MFRSSKRNRIFVVIAICICTMGIACGIYVNDYYKATPEALVILSKDTSEVTIEEKLGKRIAFIPENPQAGIIFYPGGKVQYEAYVPLLMELAKQDILCVLVHMPANLAVLNVDAAEGITEEFASVATWYMAGHSLGGSMAAAYIADHTEEFEGLILLASYSTADLSKTDLQVLSIYGSEDQVLNREKYEQYKANLPEDYTECMIEGGCHAYFGSYGAQDGDGVPYITEDEQQIYTVEQIAEAVHMP